MAHHSLAPDITGNIFGEWTVLERAGSMPYGGRAYLCRCSCGTERVVSAASLRKGNTTNCGCASISRLTARSTKHGLYAHPTYRTWCRMRERCYYVNHKYYDRYGGRGIGVCDRWQEFLPFYEDMAPTWKKGMTLERLDNDKDYSPHNCVWATRKQQSRNRSNTVTMELNGQVRPLAAWAEITGIPQTTLRERKRRGWSDDLSLTTPKK